MCKRGGCHDVCCSKLCSFRPEKRKEKRKKEKKNTLVFYRFSFFPVRKHDIFCTMTPAPYPHCLNFYCPCYTCCVFYIFILLVICCSALCCSSKLWRNFILFLPLPPATLLLPPPLLPRPALLRGTSLAVVEEREKEPCSTRQPTTGLCLLLSLTAPKLRPRHRLRAEGCGCMLGREREKKRPRQDFTNQKGVKHERLT